MLEGLCGHALSLGAQSIEVERKDGRRRAPAESDLERYFQVSAPSIHGMVKTLERNGLIERTPRLARSIRLLVRPEHLPPLE